ncbi:hypothetical protein [uncultured Deinococcus sp.]|uniref:beta strand repeat-containing protein n=1 Tax=uncultured Deinococcus sp. TaxID=158789 RepID=UPI0025CEDF7D|nr:hypothetical protein [uncultured Deinococcus sp.]
MTSVRALWPALLAVFGLALGGQARADTPLSSTPTHRFQGRIDYVTTGATFRSRRNSTTTPSDACVVGTTATSQAVSGVPTGATIRKALLYWAASATRTGDTDTVPGTVSNDTTVTFDGQTVTAMTSYADSVPVPSASAPTYYNSFSSNVADVTAYIAGLSTPNKAYTMTGLTIQAADVGTASATRPARASQHCSYQTVLGGWGLYIIYETPTESYKNLVIYQGFERIQNANISRTMTGLRVPTSFEARTSILAWEGDETLNVNTSTSVAEALSFGAGPAPSAINNIFNVGGTGTTARQGIFNSTISTGLSSGTTATATGRDDAYGVDFDTFDVTSKTSTGATSATINIVGSQDLFYLSSVPILVTSGVADLSVTKTVSNATPVIGSTVTYRVTLNNAGPDPVSSAVVPPENVVVTDQLPAGLTFVSATASAGSYDAATGQWSVPEPVVNTSATLDITATVTGTGTITNTTQITSSPQPDSDSTPGNGVTTEDDYAAVPLTVVQPLTVSKAFSPTTVAAGSIGALSITVTNPSAFAASAVAVTDDLAGTMGLSRPLPLRLTANSCGGTVTTGTTPTTLTAGGAASESSDGVLKLSGGSIPAGGSCTVTVQVTVPDAGAATRTNTIPVANVAATISGQAVTAAATATATLTTTTSSAGTAFTCDARFYQLRQDPVTLLSNLYRLDRRSLASGGTAVWASGFGPGLNALAFNRADGYFYAVNITPFTSGTPFRLYRLGASGAVEVVGANLGIPAGSTIAAGTIDAAGTLYLKKLTNDAVIYKYSIGSGTASTLTINGGTGVNILDLALNPVDGFLYGVVTPGGVYRINASSGATTLTGTPAAVAGDNSNLLGSAFFDVAGTLYAAQNGGTFGTVNLSTGAFTAQGAASSAAQTDGASCVFPDNRVDVVKSVGTVTAQSATTFDIPYTVTVKNTGTVSDPNIQLTENLAQTFSAGGPTLSIVAGPTVTAGTATVNSSFNGSGDLRLLSGTTALAAGASATVTFTVRVAYPDQASVPSSATILNNSVTATSTDTAPNAGYVGGLPPVDLLATDTSTSGTTPPGSANGDTPTPTPVVLPTVADLTLTKTDGVSGVPALGSTTYTITLTNAGPGSANGTVLTDPAAAGLTKTGVSCAAAGGAVCPTVTVAGLEGGVTIATLPAGGSVTLTVPATVTVTTGTVSNSVTAALPAGTVDVTPVGTVTDTDTVTPVTDVAVSKAVNRALAGPGQTLTYTIRVWNNGPNAATGVTITDPVPAALTGVTWTCAATGTATCSAASGSGSSVNLTAGLPVDTGAITTADTQYVTVTVTGTLASTATGTVANTVTTAHGSDATGGNNSATASTAVVDAVTDSSVGVPFNTAATISVLGNDTVGGAAATTSNSAVTVSANGGLAGLSVNGSGQLVLAASAGNVPGTYTVTYQLCSTTDTTACDTATVPVTITALSADLGITKTGPASVVAGQTVTYTLTITNAGPASANGAAFSDSVPTTLTGVTATCTAATGGASGCTVSVGAGNAVTGTVGALPSGSSVQITVTGTVPAAATGSLSNSASVSVPVGVTDPATANNTSATVTTAITPLSDLAIDKSGPAAVGSGGSVTYTIRVWNNGPTAATGATVTDTLPAGLTVTGITCAVTGTATCGTQSFTASSVTITTGSLTLDTAPANGTPDGNYVTYTVTGTAPASGSLSTTASVAVPAGRSDQAGTNNTSAAAVTRIIDAVNDSAVNLSYGAGGTVGVLGNDTVGGVAATTSNSTVTVTANGGLTGLGVNAAGQLVVPTGASAGTYTVTYRVCDSAVATACDTATVAITVGAAQANVGITKTGPAYAQPGQDITYTLTVTNAGPDAATTVTVTDVLPAALTYVSSSPAAGTSGQTLTWTVPTLASGSTWTATVTVKAPTTAILEGTPAARSITNTASVSSATADPVSANNSASAVTAMVYGTLGKTVRNVTTGSAFTTSGGGLPGEVLEYCIAYANYGGVGLPNFTITDHVPGTTTALATAYDADEPGPATGFGVKLLRGGVTSYLSSATDADVGALSTSGGGFGRGTMSAALGTLAVGESGSACFQVSIR